jgi:hypothetical protein
MSDWLPQHYHLYRKPWLGFTHSLLSLSEGEDASLGLRHSSSAVKILMISDLNRYVTEFL